MAIVQSNGAATSSQNGGDEFSPESDDVDPMIANSSSDSSDLDSGMESDEPDITSFLEPGTELCQVGNQTLALPIDLCELGNLNEVLSIETWNDLLSDNDKFELAKYLPDMDEEAFTLTLSQLFRGENLNFGNPLEYFFKQLKGGQCDPRVTLYRKGMNFIQKRGYYCNLRKYQDAMVSKIMSVKDALQNCDESYGIEERIRFANIIRNQEALASESDEETELVLESESGYKSDSELEISDNSVEFPKVNLKNDFVNGGFKRKNQKLGFAKIRKLGRKKPQLRYESEEETEEREDQKVFVGSHRFRGKINSKNRKNLDLVKVKGPKQKSVNKQCCTNEEEIENSSPEMKNLPSKSEEETESDLSQKERAIERIIIDSEKPKKKTKKDNKKEKTLKKAKEVKKKKIIKKEKKVKNEKKLKPRGRKGGRKRKSEDLIDVEINSNNENNNINISNNIMKLETNADENLVEIPLLQETEQKPVKRPKKKTLISESENNNLKKRKRKTEQKDSEKVEPDSNLSKKKKGRKKSEIVPDPVPPEQVKQEEIILVLEPPKKKYIPIKPTIHTDFSFSLIHLLSSVRIAMINSKSNNNNNNNSNDDDNTVQNSEIKSEEQSDSPAVATSLTVQQIAERVRSDPLDPSILTAQEPLNDLIKGVLRILSSKQAPLGFKQWKPLVSHASSSKSWYWTGPVIPPNQEHQENQELTSPDTWGLPHKSLVKLVDSFANWLKQGEETLKKLGGLGPPPVPIHLTLTEKDRFKDIKSLKSQYTISQTGQDYRSYFQKEEQIRYSIPDRAFSYTATDGRKSTVAPLGRSSNKKPSKKARDHFMLMPDRPPHVTILGLVRDAAARLPGSIGTRADVCTLIRDSQFVIADVAEEKISEVVSGALDRLHYQEDPCVRFDGERKLWVYLHREREEEDFEDDGNQSTKKWRKPKKDSTDLDAGGGSNGGGEEEGYNGNNVVDLNYGEDPVSVQTGQMGQDDQILVQTGQMGGQNDQVLPEMGQENLVVGETSQTGRENEVVGETSQENQFVSQTGQMVQENLFGFQMGQTSQVDQLWGQTGRDSEESVERQRRLGFFNRTL
ncbi:hypothetical protein LUZ60_013021 [Juncus effusus]|nr:hypothetical protein LUZ60_013021 [Juncus effusus]